MFASLLRKENLLAVDKKAIVWSKKYKLNY